MKLKIILDETQLGDVKQDNNLPLFEIISIKDDGTKEFITQRRMNPNDPVLIAVTKSQFKNWSGANIECEEVK